MTQEQKITELNKLLQDALLTSQSVRKELTDEITRISEQSNTALYNAAKKYAEEKEALHTEMEVYQTEVSATFTVHCICIIHVHVVGKHGMISVQKLCILPRRYLYNS